MPTATRVGVVLIWLEIGKRITPTAINGSSQRRWLPTGKSTPLTANGQVVRAVGPSATWHVWQRRTQSVVGTELPAIRCVACPKRSSITERFKAQFRAEMFNLPNHVNLANPNACVDCPGTAGRITNIFQLATMRQMQFGLRLVLTKLKSYETDRQDYSEG